MSAISLGRFSALERNPPPDKEDEEDGEDEEDDDDLSWISGVDCEEGGGEGIAKWAIGTTAATGADAATKGEYDDGGE